MRTKMASFIRTIHNVFMKFGFLSIVLRINFSFFFFSSINGISVTTSCGIMCYMYALTNAYAYGSIPEAAETIVISLSRRFVKPTVTGSLSTIRKLKIPLTKENVVEAKSVNIGFAAKSALKSTGVTEKQKREFSSMCLGFLRQSSESHESEVHSNIHWLRVPLVWIHSLWRKSANGNRKCWRRHWKTLLILTKNEFQDSRRIVSKTNTVCFSRQARLWLLT